LTCSIVIVHHPGVTEQIDLGRLGVWTGVNAFGDGTGAMAEAAAALESAGYGAIWLGGASNNHAIFGSLLDATASMVLASGIVNIWQDSPQVSADLHAKLDAAHPGRFLLGLGSSHALLVESSGQAYEKPYSKLVEYLDELDAIGSVPVGHRALAALGPRTLRLAAERSLGAHPYLTTPEHTASARDLMGPEALIAPDQKIVLSTDPSEARAIARQGLATYLLLPNYTNNFLRLGFTEDDLADGGSDRLIDGLFAWGDEATAAERVRAHHDAGADHVCVQVLTAAGHTATATDLLESWQRVAAALS
jgi:probable F420-dependent oxidoreductase